MTILEMVDWDTMWMSASNSWVRLCRNINKVICSSHKTKSCRWVANQKPLPAGKVTSHNRVDLHCSLTAGKGFYPKGTMRLIHGQRLGQRNS